MNKRKHGILIGCVADDFTGAGDAASFLAENGVKTILSNGIPKEDEFLEEGMAVVIALKTRSIAPKDAIVQTEEAVDWLTEHGAKQLYIKYCSTFDSTPQGNIGPVVDCVLEKYKLKYTVLCPALPANKRTVRDGKIYVKGVPLHKSPMRNHPLNPMWDADIGQLMKEQGKYSTLVINGKMLLQSKEKIMNYIEEYGKDKEHFYIVPDFETEEQGRKIIEVFGEMRLLTGGSGLLAHMARKCAEQKNGSMDKIINIQTIGKGIILSGSCSKATQEQIKYFKDWGGKSIALYPEKLLSGEVKLKQIWEFVQNNIQEEVLVYCDGYDRKEKILMEEQERRSKVLEKTIADISERAYKNGYNRIIVAGGETSGAVVLALGFDLLLIGKSVAPGVPVMIPLRKPEIRLVLKSGNFGEINFFVQALNMTGGK